MSEISSIAVSKSEFAKSQVQSQVQISALKNSMESQQEILNLITETLGTGSQVNLQA